MWWTLLSILAYSTVRQGDSTGNTRTWFIASTGVSVHIPSTPTFFSLPLELTYCMHEKVLVYP